MYNNPTNQNNPYLNKYERLAEKLKNREKIIGTTMVVFKNPIISEAMNCVITPHISWAALECRQRLQEIAIDNVRAYLTGQCINSVSLGGNKK